MAAFPSFSRCVSNAKYQTATRCVFSSHTFFLKFFTKCPELKTTEKHTNFNIYHLFNNNLQNSCRTAEYTICFNFSLHCDVDKQEWQVRGFLYIAFHSDNFSLQPDAFVSCVFVVTLCVLLPWKLK